MRKLGIALIIIYFLLLLGLIPAALSEYAIYGLVAYVPILFILSITVALTNEKYPGRFILLGLSLGSLALIIFSRVFASNSTSLWEYTDLSFYAAAILFLTAVAVVCRHLIVSTLSFPASVDIIILLMPLTSFFLLEFVHFKDYVHVAKVDQIDLLAWELERNNALMAEDWGVEHNGMFLSNYDTLRFGRTLKLIDSVYRQAIEWNGAFAPGYETEKLHQPNSSIYSRGFRETIEMIKEQITKNIDDSDDSGLNEELERIRDELFGPSVYGNTILEFRFRCYIAKNRLLLLSQ